MSLPRPSLSGAVLALGLLTVFATSDTQATITGVCPDGSMFIVKKEADIPCPRAKQVDPHDMPPIRPHYLPRPYAWEQHQQQQDPNNPYNLIEDRDGLGTLQEDDSDAPQRLGGSEPPRPAPQQAGPPAPQQRAPALPPVAAAPPRWKRNSSMKRTPSRDWAFHPSA